MKSNYYVTVRLRTNEMHAIHKEGCPFLEDNEKRIYLGAFDSVQEAEKAGSCHFTKTKLCLFCSPKIIAKKENQLPEDAFPCLTKAQIRLTGEIDFFCSEN